MEVIILAGGLGTRLSPVTHNKIPKVMVDIDGYPFLKILFDYLSVQGIEKILLSVGYKHEIIKEYFGLKYKNLDIEYIVEKEPLGTGGAIKKAMSYTSRNNIFVLNGDTYFNIDLNKLMRFHLSCKLDLSITVKLLQDSTRYGYMTIENSKITGFQEKTLGSQSGYVNGGTYLIRRTLFDELGFEGKKFSFEIDFLQKKINNLLAGAFICDDYFVDIGIPEDYKRAQKELKEYVS